MIDPVQSLSFSMHANPGVYAVLLGSGTSRAAQIPTGWEITLDLVRKLGVLQGDGLPDDPAAWYRTKFEREPDYSVLLDDVAKTPTERQQLLKGYWEPTEAERDDGLKQPTAAHKRIAELVAKGFVRVVITTNFDRLMETALTEAGVTPTVVSNVDQISGALPLIHTACCVIKVHGDYLDTRIKNTSDELEKYEPSLDRLLDQVFDEFGLVVCGWSADWDQALRIAITRCPSRRFAMYWASRGTPSEQAASLIHQRGAHLIGIDSADAFFTQLSDNVAALVNYARPHPLSKEIAVGSLKRYLAEEKYRIQLEDLVSTQAEKTIAAVAEANFVMQGGPSPTVETFTERVHAYEAMTEIIVALAAQSGYWSTPSQQKVWGNTLMRFASVKRNAGAAYKAWSGLVRYPATLLFYALGVGAVESENLTFLGQLLNSKVYVEHADDTTIARTLPAELLFEDEHGPRTLLAGRVNRTVALSEHLHDLLRPEFSRILPSDAQYSMAFDRLEVLAALSFAVQSKRSAEWYFVPRGCWIVRGANCNEILRAIGKSLDKDGDNSIYVRSAIIGPTAAAAKTQIQEFEKFRSGNFGRGG